MNVQNLNNITIKSFFDSPNKKERRIKDWKSALEINKPENTVLTIYKPILSILFWFGNFPLKLQTPSKFETVLKYRFKLISFETLHTFVIHLILYALTVGVLLPLGWATGGVVPESIRSARVINLGLGLADTNKTSLNSVMGLSFEYLVPLTNLLTMFLQTLCCASLATFILNWREFEVNFGSTFGPELPSPFNSLGTLRNRIALFYIFAGIIPLLLLIALQIKVLLIEVSLDYILGAFTLFLLTLPTFCLVIRDCYSVLMCMTMVVAVREVSLAIESSSYQSCSRERVEQWTNLVHQIRRQMKQMNYTLTWMGVVEINFLFYTFLASLFLFYVTFSKGEEEGNSFKFVAALGGLSFWCMLRITFRTAIADKIGEEEKKLADTVLLKSGGAQLGTSTRLEMKFLYDYISQSPSKIKFGSLITFERGLAMRIVSQVVTYLIVLIQFDSSSSRQ